MYLFWDVAIHPILKHLQPSTILEIGSDLGQNTERLLAYCRQNQASLHVIDPLPRYDTEEWRERYGDAVIFHKDLSLNVLSRTPAGELVIIDGDHNWYTVFHELKLVERQCAAESQPFPVILIHAIDWPYGRRDSYYNPENIPVEYRHAHKQQGPCLDGPGLLESGGFNSHLQHSVYENSLRNGVRTAIEDFMEESQVKLSFYELAGFHGLGILVTEQCEQEQENLKAFLRGLETSEEVMNLMRSLERKRLEGELGRAQHGHEVEGLKQETVRLRAEIENLQADRNLEIEKYEEEFKGLGAQIKNLQKSKLNEAQSYEEKIQELGLRVESLQQDKQSDLSEISDREREVSELKARVESLQQSKQSDLSAVSKRERELEREVNELKARVESLQQSNQSDLSVVSKRERELEREVSELKARVETLKQSQNGNLSGSTRSNVVAKAVLENGYDYLDFGCGAGGSLEYGKKNLGGTRGLGLDISPDKVGETVSRGYDAIVADVTMLTKQKNNIVRFVTLLHFLEHAPGFDAAKRCLVAATAAASDFVLVRQPWFDSDGELFGQGLKLYWSDWHGHPNAMSSLDFYRIISSIPKVRRWGIYGRRLIEHSDSPALHPLSSPRDQQNYDPAVHPPKPSFPLSSPAFYDIVIVIQTGDAFDVATLRKAVKVDRAIYESPGMNFLNGSSYAKAVEGNGMLSSTVTSGSNHAIELLQSS